MGSDTEWLRIDASCARFFRIGEDVIAGEMLGVNVYGGIVKASSNGRVVQIQYDIDSNEIIVAVAPFQYSAAA